VTPLNFKQEKTVCQPNVRHLIYLQNSKAALYCSNPKTYLEDKGTQKLLTRLHPVALLTRDGDIPADQNQTAAN
jgi:hypothetical protein